MKKKTVFAILSLFLICFFITSCEVTACDHLFAESDISREATCLETGTKSLICTKCGYVKEEVIAKSDHNMQISAIHSPTCTESGYTEYACTVCGTSEKDDFLPALNHNYQVSATYAPTCTEKGYTLMVCASCGDSKQSNILSELGHTLVTDPAVAATCTESGLTEGKHCSVCSVVTVKQNVVGALGHTEVIDGAVAPTCISTGLTEGKHCSVCSSILVEQQMLAVIDHDFSNAGGACRVCGASACMEYNSYEEFYSACNVTDDGVNVRFLYDNPQSIVLNLQKFVFPSGKQYTFAFGSNAGGCSVSSNGTLYSNITFEIEKRLNEFELTVNNASFENVNTVIRSDAYCLYLTFSGENALVLQTIKAANGADGKGYGPLQIGNGENGGRGADAAPAIFCNGMLNITCSTPILLRGGDGGDGGNGGNSDSSGSSGGTGGDGGNGAVAVYANDVEVSFTGGVQRSDFSISGGAGGSQGIGGQGRGFLWIGTTKAPDGQPGSSATVCNVNIRYNPAVSP